MITRRMRRELVDNLGYLSSEVDEMEPSVAAIVIERGLARPSNGMPKSWKVASRAPRRTNRVFRTIGRTVRLVTSVVKNSIIAFRMASTKAMSLTVAIVVVPFVVNVLTSEEGITRESVKAATSDTKDMLIEGVGEIKKQKKRAKQFNAFTNLTKSTPLSSIAGKPKGGETKSNGSGSGTGSSKKALSVQALMNNRSNRRTGGSSGAKVASTALKRETSHSQPTPLADAKKSRFNRITAVLGKGSKSNDKGTTNSTNKGGDAEKLDFDSFERVMDAKTPTDSLSVRMGIIKNSIFPSNR